MGDWMAPLKGGSSRMLWRGPKNVLVGSNCPKKSILSMQRHRPNASFVECQIILPEPLGGRDPCLKVDPSCPHPL